MKFVTKSFRTYLFGLVVSVRSTHTEIVESNSSKTEVQWSKVYYDFMQDDCNEENT